MIPVPRQNQSSIAAKSRRNKRGRAKRDDIASSSPRVRDGVRHGYPYRLAIFTRVLMVLLVAPVFFLAILEEKDLRNNIARLEPSHLCNLDALQLFPDTVLDKHRLAFDR